MDRAIDGAIEAMSERIEGMDDARKEMSEKELRDYFWCYFKCEQLRHDIDEEGMIKVNGKGAEVENPKLNILHKLTGRKSTMFSQIMRWLPKGDEVEDEEADGFDSFIS